MAYRIDPCLPLDQEARRIVGEQFDRAAAELAMAAGDPREAARRLRTRLKKLRGLLCLLRKSDKSFYARENARYRELSQSLGNLRDAASCSLLLDRIAGETERPAEIALIGDRLDQGLAEGESASRAALAKAQDALDRGRLALGGFEVSPHKAARAVAAGLGRNYGAARRALRKASANGAPQHLHELRKRLKYYWMHLKLLRDIWPATTPEARAAAKTAADSLGAYNDLVVLVAALDALLPADDAGRQWLSPLVVQRAAAEAGRCVEAAGAVLARSRKAVTAEVEALYSVAARPPN